MSDQGLSLRVGYATDDTVTECRWSDSGKDLDAWTKCVADAIRSAAWNAVAERYLRGREWLEEVRPFIAQMKPLVGDPAFIPDALAALEQLHAALPPRYPVESGARSGLERGALASGQTTTYPAASTNQADRKAPQEPGQPLSPDDGVVRAGLPARFRDNLDDTITDLLTGLMWEKKCDCPGKVHDMSVRRAWSDRGFPGTIWEWLEELNSEDGTGFAGHRDWRIPNIKELASLIDYETFNPAVAKAFDGEACGLGCENLEDPACSCTWQGQYWSSTTFADDPEAALLVYFNLGVVGDGAKHETFFVRAVRGGK